jgi:hypothetical protein
MPSAPYPPTKDFISERDAIETWRSYVGALQSMLIHGQTAGMTFDAGRTHIPVPQVLATQFMLCLLHHYDGCAKFLDTSTPLQETGSEQIGSSTFHSR